MQKKGQAHASSLWSSTSSWISKLASPPVQRRFSQFRKIQVYHFKETISDFWKQDFERVTAFPDIGSESLAKREIQLLQSLPRKDTRHLARAQILSDKDFVLPVY